MDPIELVTNINDLIEAGYMLCIEETLTGGVIVHAQSGPSNFIERSFSVVVAVHNLARKLL